MERGVIRNREWASRIRNFKGMRFGNITPTDWDGMIEYKNKCFIFFETKFMGAEMEFGQKLAFQRVIDGLNKPAILFVSEYCNEDGDIDFAKTIVTKKYFNGNSEWEELSELITLREATEEFINNYG